MRSTPTKAFLLEPAETPLKIRRMILGNCFLLTKIQNDYNNISMQLELLRNLIDRKICWRMKPIPILVDCLINIKESENVIYNNSKSQLFQSSYRLVYKKIKTPIINNLLDSNIKMAKIIWPNAQFIHTDEAKLVDC